MRRDVRLYTGFRFGAFRPTGQRPEGPFASEIADPASVSSGIAVVDAYLADGYASVPGMSSRFAAAIAAGLMGIQTRLGVSGPIAEIGTFEGRFFIALAKALQPGEMALGMDIFDWPNPQVIDRFEANCAKHGVPATVRKTWKCDSRLVTPAELIERTGGAKGGCSCRWRAQLRLAGEGSGACDRGAGRRRRHSRRHAAPATDADGDGARYPAATRDGGVHHRPRDDRRRDQVRAVPVGLVRATRPSC
jgi:hypothetical protein